MLNRVRGVRVIRDMSEEFDEGCIFDPLIPYEDEDKCECEFSRFGPLTEASPPLKENHKPYTGLTNYNLVSYGKEKPKVNPPSTIRGNKTYCGYRAICPYCALKDNVMYWSNIGYCYTCELQWNVKLK